MHKKIFFLSVPLVLSNIALPLSGIINTAIVGHLNNSNYLAVVALGVSIITCITQLFYFFRMSMTGIIAQNFGKNNFQNIAKLLIRALILAIFLSSLILIFKNGIFLIIKNIISLKLNLIELLNNFYNIAIYVIPFALINYVFLGFFIGVQKTKLVFYSSLIVTISSALMSIVFVNCLNFNIYGIAYSLIFSQIILMLYFFRKAYLFFQNKNINIFTQLKDFKLLNLSEYIPFIMLNSNIFIRSICLLISLNSFYIFSTHYGKNVISANAILVEIAYFISAFLDAIANTVETLVGESYVNKNKRKLIEILKKTLLQCMVIAFIFVAIYFSFYKEIIYLFTSIKSVQLETYKYVGFSILLPLLASFSFWIDGVCVGMLKIKEMRNAVVISMIIYLISIFLLWNFENYGLWISLCIFFTCRGGILAFLTKKSKNFI